LSINFGLKPFWFWNGDMENKEIRRQIKEMADKGIGGFFIHPRQGLSIPYMSDEWFDKIAIALEEAKRRDLEVWLYDEYPYPSGISGGEVTLHHPEFKAKVLVHREAMVSSSQHVNITVPWGETIMACAYPVESEQVMWDRPVDLSDHIGTIRQEHIFQMSGLTDYNRKRYFTGDSAKRLSWRVPAGKWKIYIFMQVAVRHFKYFDEFVDPLNPNAVAYFIQTTHEKYKERFGHEFGRTIKGIFSDEISPLGGDIPWSPLLPDIFEKRCGYSLIPLLPALLEPIGESTKRLRYDYWNTVTNAFIESFDVQIRNWCHENNLLYVGEKPILRSSQLKYMDIPGIDAGHQKVGSVPALTSPNYRADAKVLASAAHFYNKRQALCECFHSIGWGMTTQDMKWIFDWLAVQGVNVFVPHAFFYTTDGLTKHDAPPSSFFQMPAWEYMKDMADYVEQLAGFLSAGQREVAILVIDPITSFWTAMGESRAVGDKLKNDFARLQQILLEEHWDFYIADHELLADATIEDGRIVLNNERFDVLILPPMLNIPDQTFEFIKEYDEQAGFIISVGCMPLEKVGDINDTGQWFSRRFMINAQDVYDKYIKNIHVNNSKSSNAFFVNDVDGLSEILEQVLDRDISIESDGKQNKKILAAHIHHDANERYFMVNISGQNQNAIIKLRNHCSKNAKITALNLDGKGERLLINYIQKDGWIRLSLSFEPYRSYALEISPTKDKEENLIESDNCNTYNLDIKGQWDLDIEDNFLRMDRWQLEVYQKPSGALVGRADVRCMPIIDQMEAAQFMIPLKTENHFGCPKQLAFPELLCCYSSNFIYDAQAQVCLLMEPNSIYGKWYIKVNQYTIYPADFVKRNVYIPSNLTVDITSMIKPGMNSVQVFVETRRAYDGLVNPLYIYGLFSAYKDKGCGIWRLSPLMSKGSITDPIQCGIPFYAGKAVYRKMIDNLPYNVDEGLYINLWNEHINGPIELSINGYDAGSRSWSPYTWYINNKWLKPDFNEIKLCVTNTLTGLFEGEIFDPQRHKYLSID
jgi:hypothetical protein